MQSEKLIQTLIEQARQSIIQVKQLKFYDLGALTWRENSNSWNMLECIEHLNLYGDFYLPQIENKIAISNSQYDTEFRTGWLGNYFSRSMLPKGKLNKMKTFKDKDTLHAKLDKEVLDRFINQQYKLIELLTQARNVSLNKIKIEISIISLIKLKLGDTFQFFINHIIRHLKQIDRIQIAMEKEPVGISSVSSQ